MSQSTMTASSRRQLQKLDAAKREWERGEARAQLRQLSASSSSTAVPVIQRSSSAHRWYCAWNSRHGDRSVLTGRPAKARASVWARRCEFQMALIVRRRSTDCRRRSRRLDRATDRSTTASAQDVRFYRVRPSLDDARPFRRRLSRICIGNISR